MRGAEQIDRLPREVVLELNTDRKSQPIFWPGRHLQINRPAMTLDRAAKLFRELSTMDDIRLTLGGVGDPLLSPDCFDIIAAAKAAGISGINIETDLISTTPDEIKKLAESGVDVISIHFPAAHSPTYAALMGVDGFSKAYYNVQLLEEQIKNLGNGIPLISMIFTKMPANLGEMELWYDYWLRRFGHAVIIGPSDFAKQIPDLAVADMSPQIRKPCARLSSRMTILSDGTVVSCEQDVLGKQAMGILGETPIQEIWQQRFGNLRKCHQNAEWTTKPLCGACREWHR
jgi:spiro-SPASM protein